MGQRLIYISIILVIAAPLYFGYTLKPARMPAAEKLYNLIEEISTKPAYKGKVAFIALDFGPNTKAENEPQAEVVIEHLFRKRVPVILFTQYALASGFLKDIPERIAKKLQKENPSQRWEYGKDWVNLGFRPGQSLFIQALAKSDNLPEFFAKDAYGAPLKNYPLFKNVKSIFDISFLAEFTGLVGVFDTYVQFFQKKGYTPKFGHGCTSITTPEAYIYLDSGQLKGLLEGIGGAAWYSYLLKKHYPKRAADSALLINTSLGVAHLAIIFFIVLGNLIALAGRFK
ncbi:MAG: hypothetical protein D6780_07135 [Candidatus Dadabacteria bacterium]|nr:MAG: hypothetical protein D6780_07135 [Candidatus Dadabacteria bacterium]